MSCTGIWAQQKEKPSGKLNCHWKENDNDLEKSQILTLLKWNLVHSIQEWTK